MSKRANIRMERRWSQARRRGELTKAQIESEIAEVSRQMDAVSNVADSVAAIALYGMIDSQRKQYVPNPKVLPLAGLGASSE